MILAGAWRRYHYTSKGEVKRGWAKAYYLLVKERRLAQMKAYDARGARGISFWERQARRSR